MHAYIYNALQYFGITADSSIASTSNELDR
jgi:hypothetical protein